jgi:hypothetical protein
MERSREVVAAILRTVATAETQFVPRAELVSGVKNHRKEATDAQIDYHIMLVTEAGLLAMSGDRVQYRLTWDGHDYFDEYRNQMMRPMGR